MKPIVRHLDPFVWKWVVQASDGRSLRHYEAAPEQPQTTKMFVVPAQVLEVEIDYFPFCAFTQFLDAPSSKAKRVADHSEKCRIAKIVQDR